LILTLDESLTKKLAGFAVKRTDPSGKSDWLLNRLSFTTAFDKNTTAKDRVWTPSNKAPFQKFYWVDFGPEVQKGTYEYVSMPMYFDGTDALSNCPSAFLLDHV